MSAVRADSRAGFALPVVLVTISILTLIFLTIVVAMDDLYGEIATEKAEAAFHLEALSAEAQFAYLATTEPLTIQGLNVGGSRYEEMRGDAPILVDPNQLQLIKLDASPYGWNPRKEASRPAIEVLVQDEGGLLNLSYAPREALVRLFMLAGSDGPSAGKLASEAVDFRDVDDLLMVDGAEAADYSRAGLPPPTNRPFQQVSEINGILSWETRTPPLWRQVVPWVAARPDGMSFNINSAPVEVLMMQFGITKADAQMIVDRRRIEPLYSLSQVGLVGDDEQSYTFPSGRFRFSVVDQRQGIGYSSRMSLTPASRDRPIWVEDTMVQRFKPRAQLSNQTPPAFPRSTVQPGD